MSVYYDKTTSTKYFLFAWFPHPTVYTKAYMHTTVIKIFEYFTGFKYISASQLFNPCAYNIIFEKYPYSIFSKTPLIIHPSNLPLSTPYEHTNKIIFDCVQHKKK